MRQEETIKRFIPAYAPEIMALSMSLGLAIKGIEYVHKSNERGQTEKNI